MTKRNDNDLASTSEAPDDPRSSTTGRPNGGDMRYAHAVVWLDHLNATVIGFFLDTSEKIGIHSTSTHRQIHRKSGMPGSGHAPDDVHFFAGVAAALAGTHEILVTGPGTAKIAFTRYLEQKHPELRRRIVATETLDHPSDGELLAYARKYFKRVDQLGTF